MYQYICSKCGGHLDPGEKCDCEEEKKKQHFKFKTAADGQLFISFKSVQDRSVTDDNKE